MSIKLLSATVALAVMAFATQASAVIFGSFDVLPNSIFAGGSADAQVTLLLGTDPLGTSVTFVTENITLTSGNGITFTQNETNAGTAFSFGHSFSYPDPGNFDVGFVVAGTYLETFPSGNQTFSFSFSENAVLGVTATPLPAALPLFAGGVSVLCGLGLWRRRGKLVRAAA